jgi:hypothetical protein
MSALGISELKNSSYQKKRSQSKNEKYEPPADFNISMNQQHILQNLQKLKIEKKLKGMPNIERYSPLNTYLKQSSNK